jgi:hypothetical protein
MRSRRDKSRIRSLDLKKHGSFFLTKSWSEVSSVRVFPLVSTKQSCDNNAVPSVGPSLDIALFKRVISFSTRARHNMEHLERWQTIAPATDDPGQRRSSTENRRKRRSVAVACQQCRVGKARVRRHAVPGAAIH